MSTILDALKRLENEHYKERVQKVPISMAAPSAVSNFFRLWKICVLTLVVLVVLGGAVAYFWDDGGHFGGAFSTRMVPQQEGTAVNPHSDAHRGSHVHAPSSKKEGVGSAPNLIDAALVRSSRNMPLPKETDNLKPDLQNIVPPAYSKDFQSIGRAMRPSPGPDTDLQHPPSREASPIARDQREKYKAQVVHNNKAVSPSFSAQVDHYKSAATFTGGMLHLQAISWSRAPSARITVINSHILREGESIEGYAIIQIMPQGIVISKDGKNWVLGYDHQN